MSTVTPRTPQELAEAMGSAAAAGQTIALGGNFTKQAMGGPSGPAEVTVSSAGLSRVLAYEPRDLTISVQAGVRYAELRELLARDRLMLPLDPPFAEQATLGGIVAANTSGPRRRLYGAPRDVVIGMEFATLEGKLIQSGGMVVKNVAGLDMAKLMIGSFGTLAGIAVVNFKLFPVPPCARTFLLKFGGLEEAVRARDRILKSVLTPAAIDLVNPPASAVLGREGYTLAIQAGGSAAVIERYARELPAAEPLAGASAAEFWRAVQEFTPRFLAGHPGGAVVRISGTLSQVEAVMGSLDVPAVARAGTGVCYGYYPDAVSGAAWMRGTCLARGWKAVIEFAPPGEKQRLDLWPNPGPDLEVMRRVKRMFDPRNLLNPGRLYGRI
jgi:glycolate oxidase FAD binding subunit